MLPAKSYIGLVDLVLDKWAWSVTSPTGLVARKVFREDCVDQMSLISEWTEMCRKHWSKSRITGISIIVREFFGDPIVPAAKKEVLALTHLTTRLRKSFEKDIAKNAKKNPKPSGATVPPRWRQR